LTAAAALMPVRRRPRRRGRPVRRWLRALAILTALWAVLWLAAGDGIAPVRLGLYISPLLIAGTGLCCLFSLLAGVPVTALAHGAVGLVLLLAQPPSLGRAVATPTIGNGALTVTTLSNRTLNRDMAATAAAIKRHPADIFVLQEVAAPNRLLQHLTGIYRPGIRPSACRQGNYLIVSRYPVGPPHAASTNTATFCTVDLPAGRIWVGSVHLPRAFLDDTEQSAAVGHILSTLAGLDAPVILAGDFNATPLTSPIRRFGADLENTFDRAGGGAGFTFPTRARRLGRLGAFLRIDHVFAPPELRPVAARVEDWHPPMADHYPVTAVLRDTR